MRITMLPLAVLAAMPGQQVSAEELPLWELGIGAGLLYQPYYLGTKERRAFVFPVPVPVYRGEIFKSDDEGVRAEIIENERISLDISMDFNLAIDSDEVDLRKGMDDIDNIFQVGPSLEILLSDRGDTRWLLTFPLRAQLQFQPDRIRSGGYTFTPTLYRYKDFQWNDVPWTFNVSLASSFLTDSAAGVFYEVGAKDVTLERPLYNATGGYAGFRVQTVLRSRNEKRLWVFFARYDNIDNASFDDSPLVETQHGFTLGIIHSRFLFKSKQTVEY